MKKLFSRLLKHSRTLDGFNARAQSICSGKVAPRDPSQGVNLSSIAEVDGALAHVAITSQHELGLSPYPVQIVGALALIEGHIAQMQTGEGKTLVAGLASIVMACAGRTVHLMTVNDYLVERDAGFLAPLASKYSLNVGALVDSLGHDGRIACYRDSNIIYGTASAFAFDYLRDGRAYSVDDQVQQRSFDVAIFDEADAILIDEARVPMILSGEDQSNSSRLGDLIKWLPEMSSKYCSLSDIGNGEEQVAIAKETNRAFVQESGYRWLEQVLVNEGLIDSPAELYSSSNRSLLADIDNCLQAIHCYRNGRDYIVKDGNVVIINASTGRMEPGRRWSDGLHQAVEAKEGVEIKPDNVTQARITMQSFARLYPHLAGMTGTAETDGPEFYSTYGLSVLVVPPHRPNQKIIESDRLFLKESDKHTAIIKDIKGCIKRGQPVLIGVPSLEKGEQLSSVLSRDGICHEFLSAKSHEREAEIISNAGRSGAVTIATNMAGRGTDIILGGRDIAGDTSSGARAHVSSLGGLRVIGTERHDSRRIDLQLQGRSGRQGDPGSTVFYLSLDDDLFKHMDTRALAFMFKAMDADASSGLSHRSVDKAIERAQGLVQGRYRDQRISLESVDRIDEGQRLAVASIRQRWLEEDDPERHFKAMVKDWIESVCESHLFDRHVNDADILRSISSDVEKVLNVSFDLSDISFTSGVVGVKESIVSSICDFFNEQVMSENASYLSKAVVLMAIDEGWSDHLATLPAIFRSVQFRSFAQKKPELEYAKEADEYFKSMLSGILERSIAIAAETYLDRLELQMAA